MAWTFGAATSDKCVSSNGVPPGNSGAILLCGWFYPTTLTAGRAYFGLTATSVIKVGTTTSDIQVLIDRATTDAVYTLSAGIVVNVWQFVCIVISMSSAGASTVHAWIGTVDTPPTPTPIIAAVTTAGSGNVTASNAHCIGNLNTIGTVAFQGNIGQIVMVEAQQLTQPQNQALSITTGGAISADDDAVIFNDIVQPLYNGVVPVDALLNHFQNNYALSFYDMGCQPPMVSVFQQGSLVKTSEQNPLTPSGATWTEERQPREWEIGFLTASKGRH